MTAIKPAVAGVIGWPVAHSKSPAIHRFWLQKLGMDGDYSRFPVHPDRLATAIHALSSLGMRGVNVTVPHKEAVRPLVDVIAPSAKAAGAINTIRVEEDGRLSGHNTDVDGITEALSGCALAGASVCMIGAGGAARAAMHVLCEARVADIALLARTPERAQALLDRFDAGGSVHGFDDSQGALVGRSVIINASPMGMTGQPDMPMAVLHSLQSAAAGGLAFDMVYAPLETAFLKTAVNAGLVTVDGLVMLIGQAATAFAHFYDVMPPREHDAELRAMLLA